MIIVFTNRGKPVEAYVKTNSSGYIELELTNPVMLAVAGLVRLSAARA